MIPGSLSPPNATFSPTFGYGVPGSRNRTLGRPDARSRLASLVARAGEVGETDPFQTATYQATVGQLTDAVRSQGQDDAGRASAMGLTAGQALASGAGARSSALASGVRGAAVNAEQSVMSTQARRQALLMQALGLEAGLDEAEKARKEAERGGALGILGQLGSGLIDLIPGVRTARTVVGATT